MLQAHIAALLVDGHERLFLGLGIGISRLAVLFCAAKHVWLVKLSQSGEALFLLFLRYVRGWENLSDHGVADLNVDLSSRYLLGLKIGDLAGDKPLVDQLNLICVWGKANWARNQSFHSAREVVESARVHDFQEQSKSLSALFFHSFVVQIFVDDRGD